jgi:AraC-like DNA-binding protein
MPIRDLATPRLRGCTRAQRLAAERVARVKAILLENLAETPSREELGRRVACSHFCLSRTPTRETGLTLSQWLRRARLERAAEPPAHPQMQRHRGQPRSRLFQPQTL